MEAEELNVLYDYAYDYKERQISIHRDEKLKLLQRTNQHWWKVVRPGINKAFFVPATYVEVVKKIDTLDNKKIDENGKRLESNNSSPASSISSFSSPETNGKENGTQKQNLATPTPAIASTYNSVRMKRGDSTRASKKATRIKNWSASLEELSKQIKFPGINNDCAESVMNLSCCASISTPTPSGPLGSNSIMPPPPVLTPSPGGRIEADPPDSGGKGKPNKPIPLPRKSVSESGSDTVTPMTPKPIPKVRTSKWMTSDGGSLGGNKSNSGGSSEVLTATSSEELLLGHDPGEEGDHDGDTLVSPGEYQYKKESVLVTRNRFESPESVDGRQRDSVGGKMKPKEIRRSSPVQLLKQSCDNPRKPSVDEVPIRPLSEHWAEYMTTEKRFYYYNSLTGATSWKPPRLTNSAQQQHRRGGSGSGGDNLSSLENSHSSLILDSSDVSENNNHFSILREEDCEGPGTSPTPTNKTNNHNHAHLPVPVGWSYVYDGTTGQGYYVNDSSGARWLSSQDPEGKIYYYEENSTKSSWFLPVPGISFNDSSTPPSKSTTSDSLERSRDVSPRGVGGMPDVITTIPSPQMGSPSSVKKRHSVGDATDRLKARSMLFLPDSRKQDSIKLGSLPRSHNQKSIWNSSKDEETWIKVIREGLLARTKITENGKKVRKNWAQAYVVLTEEHLSLFKDEKSFGIKKSEMEIELSGSTVDWSVDKTSRKHVFQLNTCSDLQILFQAEEPEIARLWIDDIQEVIKRQPVRELLRLKSTSPDPYMDNAVVGEKKSSRLGRAKSTKLKITGSVENLTSEEKNKIRAQLKKFFNRRPARESLVKKGIYKDEAVFGCHLEKLCAREGRQVPNFVQEAITAIESKDENMKTDGIYRASGNLSQVQKIRLQVDQNNLSCLYQEEDVHVLAGALKLFFREMREPLIPSDLFSEALTATNVHSKKEKISKFRDIIGKLAKPNRATLHALLKHLLRVSEYSEYNRMLIPNLAIVFGPTLMWPATESTNMALDLMQQNFVIEALLLDFEMIFEKR